MTCTWRKERLVRDCSPHELPHGPVVVEFAGVVRLHDLRIALELEEAAGVVEQLPDGDLLAVRNQLWQPLLDAVAERELSLGDELQDEARRVGLGHAGDPKAIG